LSDSEVIELYLSRQSDLYFDMLYTRYIGKVYSKCLSLLKNEARAEDAAQEIFTKIFLNLSKFGQRSKFSTWVYSITYNFCIDLIRKERKKDGIFSEEPEMLPEIVEEVNDKELLEMEIGRLAKVLGQLPIDDKSVLLMKYQDDMSIKDISAILGKSESAIKMKLKRAKAKAKRFYDEMYKD